MAKVYVGQYWVPSRSNPSKPPYKVSETAEGKWECNCPKWKFKKAPKEDCHHITEKKENPENYPSII